MYRADVKLTNWDADYAGARYSGQLKDGDFVGLKFRAIAVMSDNDE
jgi:hypothetical protein